MLEECMKEWEIARNNAINVSDKMNEDGVTFEFRKSVVTFRGVAVELLAKRRPGSGLVKDAELDPSKGPQYLVTIFVPSTGKFIENLPCDSLWPNTERMIAILQALDVYDHEAVAEARVKKYLANAVKSKVDEWTEALADTEFTDSEKQIFIEYAKPILSNKIVKFRADAFIAALKKYSKDIIGKEDAGVTEESDDKKKKRHPFTVADAMYNIVCQCIERQHKNSHGDNFIPAKVIEGRFWNADNDVNMHPSMKTARSVFRSMYSDCRESAPTLAFIFNGLAKYYEACTGESVQLRLARLAERYKKAKEKKAAAAEQNSVEVKKTDKKIRTHKEKIVVQPTTTNDGMVSLEGLFKQVGL